MADDQNPESLDNLALAKVVRAVFAGSHIAKVAARRLEAFDQLQKDYDYMKGSRDDLSHTLSEVTDRGVTLAVAARNYLDETPGGLPLEDAISAWEDS